MTTMKLSGPTCQCRWWRRNWCGGHWWRKRPSCCTTHAYHLQHNSLSHEVTWHILQPNCHQCYSSCRQQWWHHHHKQSIGKGRSRCGQPWPRWQWFQFKFKRHVLQEDSSETNSKTHDLEEGISSNHTSVPIDYLPNVAFYMCNQVLVPANKTKTLDFKDAFEHYMCCMLAKRWYRTEEGKKLCANSND